MKKKKLGVYKKASKHIKIKFTYIKYTILALFLAILFVRGYEPYEETGENFFYVTVNGQAVGCVSSEAEAEEMLWTARKNVAARRDDLTFMDVNMFVKGEEVLWGNLDDKNQVLTNMENVLAGSIRETLQKSYTVKVNEYMVNLASQAQVKGLLQAAINKYSPQGRFQVELVQDESKEFNILSTNVFEKVDEEEDAEPEENYLVGGLDKFFVFDLEKEEEVEYDPGFDDFVYGLLDVNFAERVEVAQAYLPDSQLTDMNVAVEEVIKEQETATEYTIVSGDTLSEISLKVNIPIDKIIELNSDKLESVNTPIRVGDTLIITVPEPELSVMHTERNYYEEIYDAPIEYIDVDTWYTTQTEVIQQPSAGFRKVVADETYENEKLIARDIVKEEVLMEAVAKIVKRGTKTPPTFIKPISGGRATSGFGYRKAPTKGATSNHKAQDWATPVGTTVVASCGGVVEKAGWGKGYGYCIYINHEDGSQTRYAHLSKVLVKAGQTVKQGEKIALSGNTGVSTGPHLHFEILINGVQRNPLNYIQ